MEIEYRVQDEKFPSAADAIKYIFTVYATENINALEIRKVQLVEPHGPFNAIDHELLDTMSVKGPANYQYDALNKNF